MNINSSNSIANIFESREELLKLNPDILFGVYKVINKDDTSISFELVEDTFTAYPNQLSNLKIPREFEGINILNLNDLRKGNITYLKEGTRDVSNDKLVLLSNGMIEYIVSDKGRKHIVTTLRDGGGADIQQRTTIAGRNTGNDLLNEMEEEAYSESPFLVVDDEGNYALAIADGNNNGIDYTKHGIQNWFKQGKYDLDRNNSEDLPFIKMFERSFPGIRYEDLGKILEDIMKNNRFVTYSWKEGKIEGTEKTMKHISLGDSKMNAYVFHDVNNNTYEYRGIREIIGINDKGYRSIGNRFGRLYLESKNQGSKLYRLENAHNKEGNNIFVPTTDMISRQVAEALRKNSKKLDNNSGPTKTKRD